MDIQVRRTGKYREVTVEINNVKVDMGLLNQEECLALARRLKAGISDVLGDDDYYNLMTEDKFPTP